MGFDWLLRAKPGGVPETPEKCPWRVWEHFALQLFKDDRKNCIALFLSVFLQLPSSLDSVADMIFFFDDVVILPFPQGVCVWEVSAGKERTPSKLHLKHTLHGHTAAVCCLTASSNYNLIVSGSKVSHFIIIIITTFLCTVEPL